MVSVSVFHICFCLLNWNLPYRIFVRLSAKFRFIGVNITNLQQIVSVFKLYRKLLGDNAPVRDRHCPFSFLSVIRFTFECFPDCDIHIPNHQYGLIEIKLGGDSLIKKGAETLNALAEKIDTTRMKSPAFKMIMTATGEYAYRRPEDGIYVVPIGCLKP